MLPRALLAPLALVAVLSLAACGGSDKDDVIADGDEICRETNEKLDELNEGVDDLDSLATASREAEDITLQAVEDLKDLDPPDEERDTFDRWIEKVEEQIANIRELGDAAEAGDQARAEDVADNGEEVEDEANELARDYGFDDCAEDD